MLILKGLKNKKACGIDLIRNEYLKNCPESLLILIKDLFNLILNTGLIPTEWCIGMIMPLYKNKGSANDPDNYRGITLLSCIGKFFTSVLNYRITKYFDATGTIGDEQAGFRAGHSTMDHILVLHFIIDIYLQKGKRLYCAFIDYKKAFDFVDRSSLWQKLISCGVNGKIMTVIYNLYANAKSCVKVDSKISDYFTCNVGVRQGENLSPLLFAVFLNDFELHVSKKYDGLKDIAGDCTHYLSDDDVEIFIRLYVLLYADDTIVMAESAEQLQLALNAVYEYCQMWDLTVNTSKTKIIIFSKRKVYDYPAFLFGNDLIGVVDDYVYLGVTFNYNNRFEKAIDKQVKQANRALYALLNKARKLQLPIDLLLELFDKLVLPVLLYGCEVWGYSEVYQIEVFYRKFLKKILCVNKRTPNCMVYGETGTFPVYNNILSRMVSFWSRLCYSKQSKLSVTLYKVTRCMHYDVSRNFRSGWIDTLDKELSVLGLNHIWRFSGDNYTPAYIKSAVKLRVSDISLQNWATEVFSHDECFNYRMYKSVLCMEDYLVVLPYYDRKNIAKFRCRSNYLPVNVPKYSYEDVNDDDTKCPLCHKREVGDEFHYLFVCPFFGYYREKLIPKNLFTSPNVFSVTKVFNTKNTVNLRKLSKFVAIVMDNLKDVYLYL